MTEQNDRKPVTINAGDEETAYKIICIRDCMEPCMSVEYAVSKQCIKFKVAVREITSYRAEIEARAWEAFDAIKATYKEDMAQREHELAAERAKVARLVEALEICAQNVVTGRSYINAYQQNQEIARDAIREAEGEA